MAPKNPLAKITDAAQGAATLPLRATEKVADRAVGIVSSGVRVAANLISSTAERARSVVGTEDQKEAPGPVISPPPESVEKLAEAAVAREMAEEPLTTPTTSKTARATAPAKARKPKTVASTSTGAASKRTAGSTTHAQPDDEPLIDPATAKAVQSETDILRAAADLDKKL